jgi:hypothetical protein
MWKNSSSVMTSDGRGLCTVYMTRPCCWPAFLPRAGFGHISKRLHLRGRKLVLVRYFNRGLDGTISKWPLVIKEPHEYNSVIGKLLIGEPEGSLSCSQELTVEPSPEATESRPRHHCLFSLRFILILVLFSHTDAVCGVVSHMASHILRPLLISCASLSEF